MTDPTSPLVDLMTKFSEAIKSIDENFKKRDTEIETLKAIVEKLQNENTENFSVKVEDIKSKVATKSKAIATEPLPAGTVATVLAEAIDEGALTCASMWPSLCSPPVLLCSFDPCTSIEAAGSLGCCWTC